MQKIFVGAAVFLLLRCSHGTKFAGIVRGGRAGKAREGRSGMSQTDGHGHPQRDPRDSNTESAEMT